MATVRLIKLARFKFPSPVPCPYCKINESLGYTQGGVLGCRFCQGSVDNHIDTHYRYVQQVGPSV